MSTVEPTWDTKLTWGHIPNRRMQPAGGSSVTGLINQKWGWVHLLAPRARKECCQSGGQRTSRVVAL